MSLHGEIQERLEQNPKLSAYRDVKTVLKAFDGETAGYLIVSLGTITFRFMQTLTSEEIGYAGIRHVFSDQVVVVLRSVNGTTHETKSFKIDDEQLGDYSDLPNFAEIKEPTLITVDTKHDTSTLSEKRESDFPM